MEYKYINTEYLDSVSAGDNDVTIEIIEMFREQVAEISAEMMKLLDEKNYYNLGLLAHKAKSSVAIMGMAELAGILKTLELTAKEGIETQNYESYVTKFRVDTAEAVRELDDLICTKYKKA